MGLDSGKGLVKQDIAGVLSPSLADNTARILKLLNRIKKEELAPHSESVALEMPFELRELLISKIQKVALEKLEEIKISADVEFVANIQFYDDGSARHDTFEEFMDRVSDKKTPRKIELSWSKFTINDRGDPIAGEVRFVADCGTNPWQKEQCESGIKVTVSGSDNDWVYNTLNAILPIAETSRLGFWYRPLWLFRWSTLIDAGSWIGAFAVFIFVSNLINRGNVIEQNQETVSVLSAIQESPTSEEKVDILAGELFQVRELLLWKPVGDLITMMFIMICAWYILRRGLPFLAPSSHLLIGLAKHRLENQANKARLAVLSVFLTAIIIPSSMSFFFS